MFAGIQGSGGDSYQGPYTWGGSDPRRVVVNHHANGPAGTFKIRDDYDGEWLYVHAGEMVPLTEEVRASKNTERIATRAELRELSRDVDSLASRIASLLRG